MTVEDEVYNFILVQLEEPYMEVDVPTQSLKFVQETIRILFEAGRASHAELQAQFNGGSLVWAFKDGDWKWV